MLDIASVCGGGRDEEREREKRPLNMGADGQDIRKRRLIAVRMDVVT